MGQPVCPHCHRVYPCICPPRSRPLHLVEVRRRGSEHQPLRWRAWCVGCKTWRLGLDGSYPAWLALMSGVMFHIASGRWR